jgi:hypothetical protein
MKTKMKTVRILIPILLLFVLLSAVSPVLAVDRLTFQYAVTGKINNMDQGVEASMSLILKGTLTLGTPNYDSGWSGWRIEDRGWTNNGGAYDLWFSWDNPDIPQWVKDQGFNPVEGQFRAHVEWDTHEHWMDYSRSWDCRWYTPKGSWSGQLVAMWDGGTSYEKFSVTLSPWKVEKILTEGNMYMAGDSSRHEHWEIYRQNPGGGEEHVASADNSNVGLGGGFDYHAETLQIYLNGKFTAKNKRLEGRLDLKEDKFWITSEPSSFGIGLSGNGEFGPYSFQFPS